MTPVSFNMASYVARQLGYSMPGGFSQGQSAVEAYFRPVETYAVRFSHLLEDVCRLGFDSIDLWLAHLSPDWATERHIDCALSALARCGMRVASLTGWFGGTLTKFEQCCQIAQAVGAPLLGGTTSLICGPHRAGMLELLEQYNLRLGLENHPEKTPAEMLAKLDCGALGRIGTCIDTGVWAAQGCDVAQVTRDLLPHVVYVHLKDVERFGVHETCRYGRGIVPLQDCVTLLQEGGYTGGYSVEHAPSDYNPGEDLAASAQLLRGWLNHP